MTYRLIGALIVLVMYPVLALSGVPEEDVEDVGDVGDESVSDVDEKEALRLGLKHRLEVSLSYDYLSPYDPYGSWYTAFVSWYGEVLKNTTAFAQVGGFSREEGGAVLGVVGMYRDWVRFLYTYTALFAGSNSTYLPIFAVDHSFNFKLIEQLVLCVPGITYAEYYTDHTDLTLYAGPSVYLGKWVLEYRIFRNESDPGDVVSYSHLASVGYGAEGWFFTTLTLTTGQQAYMATYTTPREEVRQDAFDVVLGHRHWLSVNMGLLGTIGYTWIEDGYDKYGITLGAFWEF